MGEQLPSGWKVSGDTVYCQQRLLQRYRRKSITMSVAESSGTAWQELREGLEESWIGAIPRGGGWEARITRGQPVVRVLIRERWWELRLKGVWSRGQRFAYEKIASGAAVGELFFDRVPPEGTQLGNGSDHYLTAHSEIRCRLVAWLPRKQIEDPKRPQYALPDAASRIDPGVLDLEEMDIRSLRDAIRVNRVSFPSQVPTFTTHRRRALQSNIAQLYFVLGWSIGKIGARYELGSTRVREILDTWKRRAVRAEYIQCIPPAEAASQQLMVTAFLRTFMRAIPDTVPRFLPASFSSAAGGFQNNEHGTRSQ